MRQYLEEMIAPANQPENAQTQNPAPLIVNGVLGVLAAKHVEQEYKQEMLKFQPNLVEKAAKVLQDEIAIQEIVQLIVNGVHGVLAVRHVEQEYKQEMLKFQLNLVEVAKVLLGKVAIQELVLSNPNPLIVN